MRIFKNKAFTRFAKKSGIDDASLCKASRDAERGLLDADLGGGVIKQRVARIGGGKSGGFRTLIVIFRRRLHRMSEVDCTNQEALDWLCIIEVERRK